MVTGLAFALVLQQRVDVPAGLHTLGEIAEHATKAGTEVVVAPLEADRMFAARLVDMEPIAALRAVVSAAGDLEIKAETKEDKTVFKVQADQAVRAKNDAVAARIFNELLADYRKSLIAVREEASKLRGLKIEERQPIARQLQAEYDFIYEQWDKDRTDLALRKKLLELTPALYAHTLAGEVWNMFPLEALHNVGNLAPRSFRDVEQWQARLSEMPGGFARLRTLSTLVPGREALQDVVFEFKVGSTPDYLELSPKVIAILSETVESPISLTTGMIELRDCLRPAMKFHFERTCAHFSREPFVPTVVELPLSAKKAVTFEDIGEKVDALSQAALLWSHFSETNLVCELVPNAEALSEQPEQGQRISLDQIMVHTNKWSLREVDGALVLTCDTRVVDSARQPIKAARDAGLLMWKRIERINIHPIDRLVKYGRAALATRGVWSPRGRSIFTGSYYGLLGFEFDDIAFNMAVADALSLFDNEEGIKAGTFPLAPANQTKLRAALEYHLNCTTRTETRHPLISELFTQGTFVVGPVGNRGWQSCGTRFGHPLLSALRRVTNFRPSQN